MLNNVIGVELLSQSLLPAIIELSTDTKWRVRFAIIELMPMLINQLGLEFFNDQLCELTLNWLCDRVYTIRRAASENLSALTEKFGEEWTIKHVVPKLTALQKQPNYLHRIIGIYALSTLTHSFSNVNNMNILLPIVLNAAADNVPNVRFTAIKVLVEQYKLLKNTSNQKAASQIMDVISNLNATDVDKDVLFYSNEVSS